MNNKEGKSKKITDERKELNKKKMQPYVFIKWKDRKTAKKFRRKSLLIAKQQKLQDLLKQLISLKDLNAKKSLVFPVFKNIGKYFVLSKEKLEKIINKKNRHIFPINKQLKQNLIFPFKKSLEKPLNKRKYFVFPIKKLEKHLVLLINRLKEAAKAHVVIYYRSIVLERIKTSRFFNPLAESEKFDLALFWCSMFEYAFKYLNIDEIINFKWEISIPTNIFVGKKINFFNLSTHEFSLKDLFLEKFLIVENSYLISLKNLLLFKNKLNDYLFFKFCYFLKIQLFYSLIKGKKLLSYFLLKLKPFFKIKPFFLNYNKFLKPVKKEGKWKAKKIKFKYRYNYSLSKVCNYFRCIYFKKRWEEKIQTEQKQRFILKSYGLFTGLVPLTKPILYDKQK